MYPYDFAALGQKAMADPVSGRPTSDGNNDTCAELKGLFSCAVYSPTAGTFVRTGSLLPLKKFSNQTNLSPFFERF